MGSMPGGVQCLLHTTTNRRKVSGSELQMTRTTCDDGAGAEIQLGVPQRPPSNEFNSSCNSRGASHQVTGGISLASTATTCTRANAPLLSCRMR